MYSAVSRAVVADHQSLCRAGLADLLTRRVEIPEVIQTSDFLHALRAIERSQVVGLIVVDINLPEMRGVAGLKRLRSEYPSVRVVVVAESRDRDLVLEALCAGVHGYILKDTVPDEIVRAFEMIIAGHVYVPPLVSEIRVKHKVASSGALRNGVALTERQIEVLDQVAAGRSNKEIARSLEIAEGTVKVHITAAFRALGVHNRVSAAAAMRARSRNDNVLPAQISDLLATPYDLIPC